MFANSVFLHERRIYTWIRRYICQMVKSIKEHGVDQKKQPWQKKETLKSLKMPVKDAW